MSLATGALLDCPSPMAAPLAGPLGLLSSLAQHSIWGTLVSWTTLPPNPPNAHTLTHTHTLSLMCQTPTPPTPTPPPLPNSLPWHNHTSLHTHRMEDLREHLTHTGSTNKASYLSWRLFSWTQADGWVSPGGRRVGDARVDVTLCGLRLQPVWGGGKTWHRQQRVGGTERGEKG